MKTNINTESNNHKIRITKDKLDHFSQDGNDIFAGTHIIADFFDVPGKFDCMVMMEKALREAVIEANATLLHIHLHPFDGGGITGVAALAESHITVHTWEELSFMSFDVFMCGESEPLKAIEVLKKYYQPNDTKIQVIKRGIIKDVEII